MCGQNQITQAIRFFLVYQLLGLLAYTYITKDMDWDLNQSQGMENVS